MRPPACALWLRFLAQNSKFTISRQFREVVVSNDDDEGFLVRTLLLGQLVWGSGRGQRLETAQNSKADEIKAPRAVLCQLICVVNEAAAEVAHGGEGAAPSVHRAAALHAWKAAWRLPVALVHIGGIASLPCQDDSVPVPKNNAPSGFPQRKQKEQLMCKYAVLKEKNRAVFLLITRGYF